MLKLALLLLLLLPTLSIDGQHRMSVSLDVKADLALKEEILKYMGDKLRSLRDVDVVTSGGDYHINVRAKDTNSTIGVILSAVETSKETCGERKYDCYVFSEQTLQTGSVRRLRRMCELYITRFNRYTLQAERDIFELLEKSPVKKNK